MSQSLLLFTASEPFWEHLLHGFIPGVVIGFLIWKRGRTLLKIILRSAWTKLTNATTYYRTGFRVWKVFTTVVIVASLGAWIGYEKGFNRGYVAGIAEVHSWTTKYENPEVVWIDPQDPLHFRMRFADHKDGTIADWDEHACAKGNPIHYPHFRVGQRFDWIVVEDKGPCWDFEFPDTGWHKTAVKYAKFLGG